MMLREIFRLEFGYQARRVSTWIYAAVLFALTFVVAGEPAAEWARRDGSFFNGPFMIAVLTLLGSAMGLLIVTAVAGDAATRDAQTRMAPLVYTTRASKTAYLSGRFLAALGLYAVLLSAVPLAQLLLAFLGAAGDSDAIGPFRPAAYLGPYLFLLLPNAFVATAIAFALAALSRRGVMGYFGVLLLFGTCAFSWEVVATRLGYWELAKLLDPLGATFLDELSMMWTPVERSTRLVAVQGAFLWNRVLWIGIALGVLVLTHLRFRLAHPIAGAARMPASERGTRVRDAAVTATTPIRRTFGFTTCVFQVLAIAGESFRALVWGWGGLVLVATAAFLVYSGIPIAHMGVPIVATTERIIAIIGTPLARLDEINWIAIPLLIVYYAGELIWREREARLSDIADAAPVPDWARFLGKFAGLGLVLFALQALMMGGGMLVQHLLGTDDFQIALYVKTLFGLQIADYLLFAVLALVIHTLVNHKYVGHLSGLIAFGFMAFSSVFGVEHNLLIYGSDPGWMYSDMRGFDPFIGPWLWFKTYWGAWALLLAVAATLFWVRGKETGVRGRLALARRRFSRRAAATAVAAAVLVLAVGGFIFYNTNVLNAYATASDSIAGRADYERRYGQYRDIPQPQVTGLKVDVDIHTRPRAAEMRGTFHLVNTTAAVIDTVHVAGKARVITQAVRFDRPAKEVLFDSEHGYRVYALETPLNPGESLQLDFQVRLSLRGFTHRGIDSSVAVNGSHVLSSAWLPGIGYQAERELQNAADRRAHGLDARPEMRLLEDSAARHDGRRAERIMVEAVVATDEGQVAVAPGRLRRTWTEGGRRYFHYVTDAPIGNDFAFFSAAYAVREGRWGDVAIQILHHPNHAQNADRMVRSVQASLDYYTKRFGPYPHGQVRLVERPGSSVVLHAGPINIDYSETFSLLNPEDDTRNIDLPFAVVAHEMAHQWWGKTLIPADVEGAALLSESLAWYSAMGVVDQALGREHLQRLLGMMREVYATPRMLANLPLLRANDWVSAYRKGPFAMYALREYIGADRVTAALRRLLEKHSQGTPPLATSLDLYRELKAVTPEPLQYLLVDLFETNTWWQLATHKVAAKQTQSGEWQVTLDVHARKIVVDTAGVETEVPMDDLIEIGVESAAPGEALYLQKHRVRSGTQRIIVTVPRPAYAEGSGGVAPKLREGGPARAGIDPRNLLIDVKGEDNVKEIK